MFKVGDRVIVNAPAYGPEVNGQHGVIHHINSHLGHPYRVMIDDHTSNGDPEDQWSGWPMTEEELNLE